MARQWRICAVMGIFSLFMPNVEGQSRSCESIGNNTEFGDYKILCGYSNNGYVIHDASIASSFEECLQKCDYNGQGCSGVEFWQGSGNCYLYRVLGTQNLGAKECDMAMRKDKTLPAKTLWSTAPTSTPGPKCQDMPKTSKYQEFQFFCDKSVRSPRPIDKIKSTVSLEQCMDYCIAYGPGCVGVQRQLTGTGIGTCTLASRWNDMVGAVNVFDVAYRRDVVPCSCYVEEYC